MAPQTHSERITALESQITGVMTAIDEIRSVATRSEQTLLEVTAKNDKKFLEIDKKAEERHTQLVAMFLKQPCSGSGSELNPNSNLGDNKEKSH